MNSLMHSLYFRCFSTAFLFGLLLTPLMRLVALRFKVLDRPWSSVKTHQTPVPYLGGVAIALSFAAVLLMSRVLTNFPTGTLHSLRGILCGSLIICLMGLVDDALIRGLGYKKKFPIQIAAAICLLLFDIRIKFIQPTWFANILTVIWIVGITNALNIIDIMDGLSSGIAVIASLGFLFISLPSEEIYVNFTSAALAGAALGFIPYNLSKRLKIFMGDTGSLLLGFVLAALSLGTSYSRVNSFAVFAPIFILGIPLYDTLLVIYLRYRKGQSPFLGSKDHFALRLEAFGFFREEILVLCYAISLLMTFIAYQISVVSTPYAIVISTMVGITAIGLGTWLARIPID